jgi:hypothetical protein
MDFLGSFSSSHCTCQSDIFRMFHDKTSGFARCDITICPNIRVRLRYSDPVLGLVTFDCMPLGQFEGVGSNTGIYF